MLSLGVKYGTQSKVKLALSALLNPTEGVIWLFCSSTCASYHCHTSNYKLIGFKCKKGCTSFYSRLLARQKKKHESKWSLDFRLLHFSPKTFTGPANVCIYMYMICFSVIEPDNRNVPLLRRLLCRIRRLHLTSFCHILLNYIITVIGNEENFQSSYMHIFYIKHHFKNYLPNPSI